MRFSRWWLAAILLAGALLQGGRADAFCRSTTCQTCPPPATGCVTEGLPLYWPSSCASYDVQKDASKWASFGVATQIVDDAFAAWAGVTCDAAGHQPSLRFMNLGPVECIAREFNDGRKRGGGNANLIVFRDDVWTSADVSDPASTLALTTVTFSVPTGQIYDADIEVNGSQSALSTEQNPSADAFDLLSILTHEAGHFLGLAHSTEPCSFDGQDCPTMNALYRRGSDAYRSLEADDKVGVCAIYPPDRGPSSASCTPFQGLSSDCGGPPEPAGGCAVAGAEAAGSGSGGVGLLLLGVGIAAGLARRRR